MNFKLMILIHNQESKEHRDNKSDHFNGFFFSKLSIHILQESNEIYSDMQKVLCSDDLAISRIVPYGRRQ